MTEFSIWTSQPLKILIFCLWMVRWVFSQRSLIFAYLLDWLVSKWVKETWRALKPKQKTNKKCFAGCAHENPTKICNVELLNRSVLLQPWGTQRCSLISTFVVHYLDSLIPILAKSKISRLYLVSVAEQASLSLTWSQTPKTGFVMTGLILRERVHKSLPKQVVWLVHRLTWFYPCTL